MTDLLALAKTVAARVETEATAAKVPVCGVASSDVHGNVVLNASHGGAPAFSLELAERKPIHPPSSGCARPISFRWCNPPAALSPHHGLGRKISAMGAASRSPMRVRWLPASGQRRDDRADVAIVEAALK